MIIDIHKELVVLRELAEDYGNYGVPLPPHLTAASRQTSRPTLTATQQPDVPTDTGSLIPRVGESAIPTMLENTSKNATTFTSPMLAALALDSW